MLTTHCRAECPDCGATVAGDGVALATFIANHHGNCSQRAGRPAGRPSLALVGLVAVVVAVRIWLTRSVWA